MKCKSLFSATIKKNISLSSAEHFHRVVKFIIVGCTSKCSSDFPSDQPFSEHDRLLRKTKCLVLWLKCPVGLMARRSFGLSLKNKEKKS